MNDSNFWLDVMDEKSGRYILPEKWEDDTMKYLDDLKTKAPNKQTKTYLDGLKKHLKDTGFLSDEQKSSVGKITQDIKGSGNNDSSDNSNSGGSDTKGKEEKNKVTFDKKQKGEASKEFKKQMGSLLGKLGAVGKDIGTKIDSKAMGAVEQGVAGGKNVKDATKEVVDKLVSDAKKKAEEKAVEKAKKEAIKKAKKGVKKESFGYKFRDYLKETKGQPSLIKGKIKSGYSVLFYYVSELISEQLIYKGETIHDAWNRGLNQMQMLDRTKLPHLKKFTHFVVLKAGQKIDDKKMITMYSRNGNEGKTKYNKKW